MAEGRASGPSVGIVGGGIVGHAAALSLARRGARPTVFERDPSPRGASPHAAGILGAQVEAHGPGPFVRLSLASRALYPAWVEAIEAASGLDVGYRRSGLLRACLSDEALEAARAEVAWQASLGLPFEVLDGAEARALEPALGEAVRGGIHFPEDAVIDPPALVEGLRVAAARAGAELVRGAVRSVFVEGGRATGLALEDGESRSFDAVVVAAGSWSQVLEGSGISGATLAPARGQMIELRLRGGARMRRVVYGPGAYLSPRQDGRVLVGSTLELVGHEPGTTAGAVRDLLASALALAPALEGADVSRLWSSFRPLSGDELPLLGRGHAERLFVATGHFRNGVLLAPLTGEIVASLVLGEEPPVSLDGLEPNRFGLAL